MGMTGVVAGAAAGVLGLNRLANSLSADDATASKRMYTAAAINAAAWFVVSRFLKMKSLGEGFAAAGAIMAVMGYNASQFEEANGTAGPGLVNGAAAVLGLPSPVALDANHRLPAPSSTTTSTTTTSTTAPLVMSRY